MFKSILIKQNNYKKSTNLFLSIRFNGKLINNKNIFTNKSKQLDNQQSFINSIKSKFNNVLNNKLNTNLNNISSNINDSNKDDRSTFNELKDESNNGISSFNKSMNNESSNGISSFNKSMNKESSNDRSTFNKLKDESSNGMSSFNKSKNNESSNDRLPFNKLDNKSSSNINQLDSNQLNESNDLIINETAIEIFSTKINKFNRELDLFKFINCELSKLQSDELVIIYNRLIELYFQKKRTNEIKLILSSNSKHLFNHTENQITKLESKCLINCLKYYTLLNLDLENDFIKKLFKILVFKSKNNQLKLDEICDLLIVYDYLNLNLIMKNQKVLFDFLMTFKLKLLNDAKDKILNNKFDFTNSELLINLICVFSDKSRWIEDNHKILNILIENLSLQDNEFNFKQSIKLLKEFKNLSFRNEESKLSDCFYELIRECNSKIYEQLILEPNDLNFKSYLINLHNRLDPLNSKVFANIYDYKILSILSLHIIDNKDKYDKQLIYNLIQNYAKFNILNKNLLELIYYQFYKQSNNSLNTNDSLFKNKITNFLFFSRFRLPFVDYNQFSHLLLNLNDKQFQEELNFRINSFHLLPDLILTDVQNLELINYVLDNILKLKQPNYLEFLKSSNYEKLNLAKIYLNLFGKFNKETINNLDNKLNLILNDKLRRFQTKYTNDDYLDNKFLLKRNVSLSNGLYINNLIAIYDRSINKLLPLNDYSQYFNSIDKINLNNNQELLVFIESRFIKGNTNFELNSNYQLKKILNLYKINTIDVYKEEYQNLSLDDQAKFFIKLALSSYNLSFDDDN